MEPSLDKIPPTQSAVSSAGIRVDRLLLESPLALSFLAQHLTQLYLSQPLQDSAIYALRSLGYLTRLLLPMVRLCAPLAVAFQGLTRLQSLSLFGKPHALALELPSELALLTALTSLQLRRVNVPVSAMIHLAGLRRLGMQDVKMHRLVVSTTLTGLSELSSLYLRDVALSGSLSHLRGLLGLSELECIRVSVGEEQGTLYAALNSLTGLSALVLADLIERRPAPQLQVQHLTALTSLRSLRLSGMGIPDVELPDALHGSRSSCSMGMRSRSCLYTYAS